MVAVFCALLAVSGTTSSEERPTQALAQALIAETHIARGEWRQAEDALRYALIFDYDEPFLRARLNHVLVKQGKAIARAMKTKYAKRSWRLKKRLLSGVRVDADERSVAEQSSSSSR